MYVQRRTALLTLAVALAALTLIVLCHPPAARAATPGSGAWYWPVGTEDFQGWDGWWVYRSSNRSWHMAQDMPSPVGHKVYAIGDGEVLESNPDAGYGGVLVVLHKTFDGHEFKAVYGHVVRGDFPKGSKVRAGQVIGRVNGCRHVHFGVHPGRAYPTDGNPYRGHTYVRTKTYGWVDPLKFLRANPRVLAYKAPVLPVVATIATSLEPTVLGTADGTLYWTADSGDGPVGYAAPIAVEATSATSGLSADPTALSLDTTRFVPTVAKSGSGWSITLKDRKPVLTAAYSTRRPSWKHSVSVTGTLLNASRAPFLGAAVTLERSIDASSWTRVGSTVTGLKGTWSLAYRPTRSCLLRVRFGHHDPYLPATSTDVTVAPRPDLRAPDEHATATHGRRFEVEGALAPRHRAGSHTVMLHFQRREAGAWVEAQTVSTTNRDAGSITRYYRRLSLPAGTWRVRAETAADSLHASTTSGWFTIAVR